MQTRQNGSRRQLQANELKIFALPVWLNEYQMDGAGPSQISIIRCCGCSQRRANRLEQIRGSRIICHGVRRCVSHLPAGARRQTHTTAAVIQEPICRDLLDEYCAAAGLPKRTCATADHRAEGKRGAGSASQRGRAAALARQTRASRRWTFESALKRCVMYYFIRAYGIDCESSDGNEYYERHRHELHGRVRVVARHTVAAVRMCGGRAGRPWDRSILV